MTCLSVVWWIKMKLHIQTLTELETKRVEIVSAQTFSYDCRLFWCFLTKGCIFRCYLVWDESQDPQCYGEHSTRCHCLSLIHQTCTEPTHSPYSAPAFVFSIIGNKKGWESSQPMKACGPTLSGAAWPPIPQQTCSSHHAFSLTFTFSDKSQSFSN